MSAHDEDETDAGIRRPARHEARLHHQEHQRSAIGAPPRPSINMPRLDSAVLQRLRKRRIAVLLNGLMNSNGTKNGDCSDVCSSPGLRFARVTMRCREDLGGFAERVLLFSQKHTLRPTRGATRHTDFSRPPFSPSRPFRPPTAPSRRTVNACNLSCQICLYGTRPLALKRAALDFRGA